jgi:hypothetical protein
MASLGPALGQPWASLGPALTGNELIMRESRTAASRPALREASYTDRTVSTLKLIHYIELRFMHVGH